MGSPPDRTSWLPRFYRRVFVGWKHSSELNSCLFKQVVVEGTLGLVTCCQHIENEATMSHGIDSEGSSYLVTKAYRPSTSQPGNTLHRNVQAGAGATVAWSSCPSVPHQRPQTTPMQLPSLDPRDGVTALLQANGPHAGAGYRGSVKGSTALPKRYIWEGFLFWGAIIEGCGPRVEEHPRRCKVPEWVNKKINTSKGPSGTNDHIENSLCLKVIWPSSIGLPFSSLTSATESTR